MRIANFAPAIQPLALGLSAAARAMSISRSMVYKLINDGELRITKIGNRSVITIAEIERYLAKCSKQAGFPTRRKPTAPIAASPARPVDQHAIEPAE